MYLRQVRRAPTSGRSMYVRSNGDEEVEMPSPNGMNANGYERIAERLVLIALFNKILR